MIWAVLSFGFDQREVTQSESRTNSKMIIVIMGVCGCGKSTIGKALADKLGWSFLEADDFHSVENRNKMSQGLPLNDQDRLPWLQSIHESMKMLTSQQQHSVVTCSALKVFYRDILRYGSSSSRVVNNEIQDNCNHGNTTIATIGDGVERNIGETNPIADANMEENSLEPKCLMEEMNFEDNNESSVSGMNDTVTGKATNKWSETKQESGDAGSIIKDAQNQGLEVIFVHLTGSRELLQQRMDSRLGHFMPPTMLQSQLETLQPLMERENGFAVNIMNSTEDVVSSIVKKI